MRAKASVRRQSMRLAASLVAALLATVWLAIPASATHAAPEYHWMPRSGGITTYNVKNSVGATMRYISTTFRWNEAYQLSTLQIDDRGLEVEAHFDNYDGKCWVKSGTVATWGTNMPHGFKDVSFDDPTEQPHPTVGSLRTRGMVADTNYGTWLTAYPGNSSTDRGTLKFQQIEREPDWLYGWDYVYPVQTKNAFASWTWSVPSYKSFTWP